MKVKTVSINALISSALISPNALAFDLDPIDSQPTKHWETENRTYQEPAGFDFLDRIGLIFTELTSGTDTEWVSE